ncbi:efflux RND transporter permease subunit [Pararhizobium mangrovi]|uniref:Efflux pump membrane transporter n=1 Tax=Pararhizobium mangrovi TaxID=2590452 RepID=A0A506UBM7_9HYPH|nr:efflux RND transporter permease subunit [Pararhizobium mangrovi]TPW30404.1 multidrug efflux RND transporter permease subunit [Pararhizobium mangrovi]
MPSFFIDRPIFAWVVALFIMLGGGIAIPFMPIAQYPNVAPPQVQIQTTYTGASAEEMYQSVTQPIEEELNGIPGLLYFESTSDSSGQIQITATFQPGTSIDQASVDVQNRIRRVEPRLPQTVVDQGLQVERAGSSFLMVIAVTSTDGKRDAVALGDYLNRNVIGELRRVDGVGKAQLFAANRAMRIWLDPDKMRSLDLSPTEVMSAIRAQNAQVTAGRLGAQPLSDDQEITATVLVQGQLTTPEQFGSIVLRADSSGAIVRLRDVARVAVGAETYNFSSRLNGKPSAALAIQLAPDANALATATAVKDKMKSLSQYFPDGVSYSIPYDTTPFIQVSIEKVLHTLVEAVGLVFLVMLLFLQNIRYTIIPTIVVPVALLGTVAVMLVAGFSINVLTMFAMVLAIGILVDDAIVVVENVERVMEEERCSPREATHKAMKQITGAIIGITLVLSAVFVPMAFFPGSVGVIYQQFALTMVVSILFSAFLALSLTPALCATFLKPIKEDRDKHKGYFGWFNRGFDSMSRGYSYGVRGLVRRAGRLMILYLLLLGGLAWGYIQLPSAFLPQEDQGFLIASVQLPPDASANRTQQVLKQVEDTFRQDKAVDNIVAILGFSFSGTGQNAALAFVTLKDWSERGPDESASAISGRINGRLAGIKDAIVFALSPPPIQGLGNTGGFAFRLQDRNGQGQDALEQAKQQLMAAANNNPAVVGLREEGLPRAPQAKLVVDRDQADTFGVSFSDINSVISTNLGSAYANDFPNQGRMQRVMVQADTKERMQPSDLLNLTVKNRNGGMVPLSAFSHIEWEKGPAQVVGYNGYPAVRLSGQAGPGYSSGQAIDAMEKMAKNLPAGFGYEWTGQSQQEIQSGSQAPFLVALSVIFVFLLLAALYESWSIPLAVLLVVPLGVIGSVAAVYLRGMPNDIYFKVGLITIIGLAAKNAILIIEFAKDLRAEGMPLIDATVEAAHLRFRPILMTSLAFTLGVLPLAFATGASAGSQNAIGTGVMGGMISATVLAIFFVPIFFVFVMRLLGRGKNRAKKGELERSKEERQRLAEEGGTA